MLSVQTNLKLDLQIDIIQAIKPDFSKRRKLVTLTPLLLVILKTTLYHYKENAKTQYSP